MASGKSKDRPNAARAFGSSYADRISL